VAGTVTTLPQKVVEAKLAPPALTIIGRVVEMRETLNWFERRPLFGQTILVTRTRQQSSDLVEQLEERGARVLEAPTLEIHPPTDWTAVDSALLGRADPKSKIQNPKSPHDWLIFTSANAPALARQRLRELRRDARVFGRAKIAAVGQSTADAVERELGLHVDLCPAAFRAESLADALAEQDQIAGRRFLLLRADIARPVLAQRLRQGGASEVADIAIYQTRLPQSLPREVLEAIEGGALNWITFTSGSTVKNFLTLLPEKLRGRLKHIDLASIGPITTGAMEESGLKPTAQASVSSIPALVDAICERVAVLRGLPSFKE
jgi:uroporphyrinogen III methyltransferase/synthase